MYCFTGICSEKCVFWQLFVHANIMGHTHTNLDGAAYYCNCMSCKAPVPNLFGTMDWFYGRGALPESRVQVSFLQPTMDWGCGQRQSSPELHSSAVGGVGGWARKAHLWMGGDAGDRRQSSGRLCLQPCDLT